MLKYIREMYVSISAPQTRRFQLAQRTLQCSHFTIVTWTFTRWLQPPDRVDLVKLEETDTAS